MTLQEYCAEEEIVLPEEDMELFEKVWEMAKHDVVQDFIGTISGVATDIAMIKRFLKLFGNE